MLGLVKYFYKIAAVAGLDTVSRHEILKARIVSKSSKDNWMPKLDRVNTNIFRHEHKNFKS